MYSLSFVSEEKRSLCWPLSWQFVSFDFKGERQIGLNFDSFLIYQPLATRKMRLASLSVRFSSSSNMS